MSKKIGIDGISFYTPKVYLDLEDLAKARLVDVNKYKVGIGQEKMSIITPIEDIVTMAAEAAYDLIKDKADSIDLLLFATESGIDYSKAAGIYLHHLLGLHPHCRVLEVKQACYAATGALQLAKDFVATHPGKRALVVSSDVAWYGLNTPGEVTQGAGAIAMVVSESPRLAEIIEGDFVVQNAEDFYRPSFKETPIVDGKLSIRSYKEMLKAVAPKEAFTYVCFHMPFATMSDKANESLTHMIDPEAITYAKAFNKDIGNIYNGSLYLSLISLLTNISHHLDGEKIGMFSYGSGAMAEFYSLVLQPGYEKVISKQKFKQSVDKRIKINVETYEKLMLAYAAKESSLNFIPQNDWINHHRFILKSITNGHRMYQKIV
jgi:hydroxymethylglutaryl-CoA synthase